MTPEDERATFERAVKPYKFSITRYPSDCIRPDSYVSDMTETCWALWQARAALDSAYRELPLSSAVDGEKE